MRRCVMVGLLSLSGTWCLSSAYAQPVPSREPGSTHIFPAGGRRGEQVKVRVGGECIPPQTRFRLWGAGVSAEPVLGAKVLAGYESSARRPPTEIPISQPSEWENTIAIAGDAPLGAKFWRLTCARGGTAARTFIVGELPEFIETESNSAPERAEALSLPVTVNGQIAGERDLDAYRVSAKTGEVITCDLAAARLGSPLQAALEVRDPAGKACELQELRVGSDPVVAFRAAQDGDYVLLVSNISHHGGPQYVYRMTVTNQPYAVFAYPTGDRTSDLRRSVELYTLTGRSGSETFRVLPEQVLFVSEPDKPFDYYSKAAPGAVLRFAAGDVSGMLEAEPNETAVAATQLTLPAVVSGRLLVAGDEDWFAFSAAKGQWISMDCRPDPPGMPTLPVLQVADAGGQVLVEANAASAPDHVLQLDWQAPAEGAYLLRVQDVQASAAGPEFLYRLAVAPALPGVSLTAASDFANVVQGGRAEWEVRAQRHGGFAGAIDVVVEGLPEGVRAEPTRIAEGQGGAKVVLIADDNARASDATLRIVGRAVVDGEMREVAAVARHLGCDDAGVTVAGPQSVSDLHLTVQHKPVFRLYCYEAYQYAYRGTVHRYAMEVERLGDFEGPIVLQSGDRQNRDLDGVEIQEITVAPGETKVDVPIYFPESMHVNVQSLTQLYTQGYAVFVDKHGQRQSTLVVSEKRNLVRTLPSVVKLQGLDRAVTASPGQAAVCRLELLRTSNFDGPMDVQLISPAAGTGLSADPARFDAGGDRAEVRVQFAAGLVPRRDCTLVFRATGLLNGRIKVISETSIPVRRP